MFGKPIASDEDAEQRIGTAAGIPSPPGCFGLVSFTLSQSGMVVHWKKKRAPHFRKNLVINAQGAVATAVAVIVVMVAKFDEGAWITLVMIPALLILMGAIGRHYHEVALQIASPSALEVDELGQPIVLVPIDE
jgi:hypothetical protein